MTALPQVTVTIRSDYATLDVGDTEAYYGYEYWWLTHERQEPPPDLDHEDTWGYVLRRDRQVVEHLSTRALLALPGCPEYFACGEMLIFCLGWSLSSRPGGL